LKLDLLILSSLVYSAKLLTDFTASYRDALDRLRVHLTSVTSCNYYNLV